GLGANTLYNNFSGSNNTAIGYGADVLTDGLTNATVIGYNAKISQSNSLILGNSDVNVGIGTTSPNTSSVLELTSNSRGLLIPRMTTAERNAISSPAIGLLVYDSSLNSFYYHNGSSWNQIGGGTSSNVWSLNGNAGTDPTTNFIGTTDAEPLLFRVHNITAGQIQTINANTGFGLRSLYSNTTGFQNTAYGNNALFANTTGNYNTAIGVNVLNSNTTGNNNTATGAGALPLNTTGDNNTANGQYALNANTTGMDNTAIGLQALFGNTTGNYNTAIGFDALITNHAGYFNTAVGLGALYENTAGAFNIGVGEYALERTTISQYNTAIGDLAGSAYDNGDNNIFVGASADVNGAGYSNVIAIGQGTICNASNQVTIGNSATSSYRAYADWSNISDGRYKKNVKEDVPGLAFINKLRPVTYTLDAAGLDNFLHNGQSKKTEMSPAAKSVMEKSLKEKGHIRYTGFVAQEVEKSAKDLGFDFSGVDAPKNSNDVYGLRYADFVVPLVKAMQEQQAIIDKQQQQIDNLTKELQLIKEKLR
ncbi:MAG TPA: tail fiber domain-containing protein, partial [Chitinophagaceae bacterium]|nr:tail fiber domain-containing protein [Chitinophagaceae bacterium]